MACDTPQEKRTHEKVFTENVVTLNNLPGLDDTSAPRMGNEVLNFSDFTSHSDSAGGGPDGWEEQSWEKGMMILGSGWNNLRAYGFSA